MAAGEGAEAIVQVALVGRLADLPGDEIGTFGCVGEASDGVVGDVSNVRLAS